MKIKSIFKIFTDPHIGPITVIFSLLLAILILYIPKVTEKNLNDSIKNKAEAEMNLLKTLRAYYTEHIVKIVKKDSEINVNFDYQNKEKTIPLPATLIHDFNEILSNENKEIKLYSNYPFPNRKDRVLKDYENEALAYLINNPNEIFIKIIDSNDDTQSMLVATADTMYSHACVNCHNTRADSPKTDWKLGETRGVLQIIVPYEQSFLLTEQESKLLFYVLIFIMISLSIHYTVLAILRQKQHKKSKRVLENIVKERTFSLEKSNRLLSEYNKAIDKSAIVSKTDLHGVITYVNDEFCKVSGYTKDELIGNNHNIIRHSSTPDSVFKDLWRTISSKNIWKGLIKNRKKDGGYYYVDSTMIPILDNDNNIEEYIAVRVDVTKLVESKIKIEEANKAKTTFLANMSHEIRTPMNAIIGFSQILVGSKDLSKENHKHASIIESSANSLLEIINDILDISKIESGTFDINYKETDLLDTSDHIFNLFSNKAKQKDISFNLKFDENIPQKVLVDDIRLKQVLSNLINNALKFTTKLGKIDFEISLLSSKNNKALIRFIIKDTGIGIPDNKVSTIFQPFIQVENESNRKYEGTGLGLSICSHIIESFKSKINVESSVGNGSTFWFDLDLEVISNQERTEKNKKTLLLENSFNGNILVAEDNSANQELMKYILDSFNVKYKIVSNGEEAVNFYRENYSEIDLILMDINMPVLDGIGAFTLIKEFEETNKIEHTPVSALTANAIKGDKEKFLEVGMDFYISKPVNTDSLKEFFNKYLNDSEVLKTKVDIEISHDTLDNIINIEKIASQIGLPESIVLKLVDKFKNDIHKDMEELRLIIEKKDSEEIKNKAHYIKNSCLNVKLKDAVDILQEIETYNNSSKEELEELYSKLVKALGL